MLDKQREQIARALSKSQRLHFAAGDWRSAPGAPTLIAWGVIEMNPGVPARLTPLGLAVRRHIQEQTNVIR